MRALILACFVLFLSNLIFLSSLIAVPAQCQESPSSSQSDHADENAIEGWSGCWRHPDHFLDSREVKALILHDPKRGTRSLYL